MQKNAHRISNQKSLVSFCFSFIYQKSYGNKMHHPDRSDFQCGFLDVNEMQTNAKPFVFC